MMFRPFLILGDMGMPDQPDDQKLNLGACLLRNAFRHWALAFSRRYMSGAPLPMLDGCMGAMPSFSDTLPPAGEGLFMMTLISHFMICHSRKCHWPCHRPY